MSPLSRRELLILGLAATGGGGLSGADAAGPGDIHREILELAARYERERRARFAAVTTGAELETLQATLRATLLRLIGGLTPQPGPPTVTRTGLVEGEGYTVEKLAYESVPGYYVPALLYRPVGAAGRRPAVLSPCGHSPLGKAYAEYQTLHVNLAKRGYVVLTYDPVGQGERSQFWDPVKRKSRFDLACGEHAVIGNALYLLGANLAQYRVRDGVRGIDLLASLPDVDANKIGCVGNSGGGTLTAYITALDRRVAAAAIGCYVTTLPRRMANRVQEDPSSDPEQDLFGFVSEGLDHAGLLALCAPRPTLLAAARLDFFPIEGTRESFDEVKRLYEVAGAFGRLGRAEAPGGHGLSVPLREAVYHWFSIWLAGGDDPVGNREVPVKPRPPEELRVCADGQASVTFRSRPLLPLALEEFQARARPAPEPPRDLLGVDLTHAAPRSAEIGLAAGPGKTLVVCVNGNETPGWREQRDVIRALTRAGHAVVVVDPRGVGRSRPDLSVKGHDYADPISGVEANIAYNAFLVGRSLLGFRVSDVLAAVADAVARTKPKRVVLCGRCDAALVACFAAAVDPAIDAVAAEEMLLSYLPLFSAEGFPVNAASVSPGLLRDFGDIPDVLARIAPRDVLISAGIGEDPVRLPSVRIRAERFTSDPRVLTDWLRG